VAQQAKNILNASKEEVETMVANNAFMLEEMKEKSKTEGRVEKEIEVVVRALEVGLDIETIAKIAKLPVSKVEEIRKKYMQ
jgi:predicted transposase YdaD